MYINFLNLKFRLAVIKGDLLQETIVCISL